MKPDPKYDLRKKFARHYFGADYDLGTARGKIVVDASGAETGFGRAAVAAQGFEKTTKDSSTAMIGAGTVMAGAGVAIAGGFALAVNSAANFEERMSAVSAVSGATGEELDGLRELALQLGADTKYSATEAASAIEELVKAGLPIEDIMNGAAKATTNLAAAGEVELAEAATIAANAMNAFNLEGKDMEHVADLIAGAANASAIDVGEFGMSLQQSGAVASLVGLSFDDLAVAIAAMGNAGIKGSDAGTSLKTFLSNLQPTTEKQISLFRELGLVTEEGGNAFFDAEGKIKSMSEIAGVLNGAVGDMTEQQRMMALETMFGSDAIRAAAIIAGEGSEGFDELAASMGKVSAEEVAEERMNNFRGALEQLTGSLETLAIRIGTPFLQSLRGIVDMFTEWVNKIGELDPEVLELGTKIALAAAGVLIFVGGLTALIGWLQKVKVAFALVGKALLLNPYVLLAVAIVALIAGLVVLYQKNEDFRESVQRVWEWIKGFVGPIIDQVILGVQAMIAAFNGEGITSDGFVGFMEQVGVTARAVVTWITDVLWPAIQDFIDWCVEEGVPMLIEAWEWISERVGPVLEEFVNLVEAVVNKVKERIEQIIFVIGVIVATVKVLWSAFGDNIMNVVEIAFNYIKGAISAALQIIRGIIMVVTGLISGDWGKVWDGIKAIVDGVWDGIYNLISTVLRLIVQVLGIAWEAITIAARNAWDWVQEKIGGVLAWIVDAVAAFGAWIAGLWNALWEAIGNFLSTAWERMKQIVWWGVQQVGDFIGQLPGRIWSIFSGAISWLWQAGSDILSGLWNGIQAVWSTVWSWLWGLPWEILSFFSGAGEWLWDIGESIIEGLLEGLKSAWESTAGWLSDRKDDILELKGPPEDDAVLLINNGKLIMQGLQRGLELGWREVEDYVGTMAPSINANMVGTALTPSAVPAMAGGTTTTNNVTLEFPNVGSASDAQEIEQALENSDVLNNLRSALRAGRRMG